MNVSSFMGLQTTLRGLLAQQRGLDVTSHNIANASTVGYTRQEATLVAADALQVGAGGAGDYLGQGVEVDAYRRLRDGFLDLQYRGQATAQNQASTTASALTNIETGLAEPGENGINALLGRFWSAWSDVANNPESGPAKQALIGSAESLATAVRGLDARMVDVAAQADVEYGQLTSASGPIVAAGREIAAMDKAIADAVAAGRAPNDLLDRRDALLDQLSAYGQVSVTDLGNGSIRVQFGDSAAPPLTDGSAFGWGDPTAAGWTAPAMTAPGGRLGALLGVTPQVAAYRAQLNDVVAGLRDSVNAIHGTTPPFFTATAGSEASTLALGVTALTVRTGTGGAGSNDLALAIAGLRGGATDDGYADLVGRIGADTANMRRQRDTGRVLMEAADGRRQELSGVSMDEEMVNMVRFQRGYQASARVMSTVDEMLDTLINRTGRVGL